ncbi:amino acid/polyamine transporter I [Myxozyma melibiosi]|uniref:Amino acid/polyamine transporter I n=1 Tax=Myxozyma melibiosi TaxID=54550 RepID=A0ABR1FD90_9ASCO
MSSEEASISGVEKQVIGADDDAAQLGELGYKQELKRSFSLLSMIGFSFAILTCWTALGTTLSSAMLNGGPSALFWGWVGVCFFTIFVVLSMAEICSAYPVAGGQYSWVLLITDCKPWGRGLSYITGWIQLAGLLCMGSTALFQVGEFVAGMAVLNNENYEIKQYQIVLITYACCLINTVINLFGNKILNRINDFALWWSVLGFVITTIVILVVSDNKRDASFVFTYSIDDGGWNNTGMAIILGILQSAYGMCCYDAPAHMSEELHNATREAPRAMVLSVFIGFITGLGYIMALLFCIVDIDSIEGSATGVPLIQLFQDAIHNKAGSTCLSVITCVCSFFASNALLTEGARSVFAFARDGAMPFSEYLCKVDPHLHVPVLATLVAAFFQCAFIAIDFGSETAFLTVMSIATVGLYVSYLLPIVTLMIHGRDNFKPGYYSLGKFWGWTSNILGSLYLVFTTIFFFFPTEMPVNGGNMNYCIVAFGITGIFGVVSWFWAGRKNYIRSIHVEVEVSNAIDVDNSVSSSSDVYDKKE